MQLRGQLHCSKALQQRHTKLKQDHNALKKKHFTQQQTQERIMRRVKAKLHQLEELSKVERTKPQTRCHENNRFSDDLRKTVMQLQSDCNVPASQCSSVVKCVAKNLFGVEYKDEELPCLQTAINIADEGHVLTKIQTAEEILAAENCTIHTDGTSRGGKKIMGHQITLDNGDTLSLGFSTLAAEDATSALDLTVNLLQEITDLYCEETEEEQGHVFKTLLSKLTSVMTDRAAVMKSFDEKFLTFLQSELGQSVTLHFLHCNAHFLLGMSHSCDTALKMKEKELGVKLGRDALPKFQRFSPSETATSRCRAEWVAFCEERDITSCVTNYRSNRFNNFFQSAAAIVHHHDQMKTFFTNGYLSHTNLKIESVAADLQDDNLMSLVCAVALLFIHVTGPYFELVQSDVKYIDFFGYIQKMEALFDRCCDDASDLLHSDFIGAFEGDFKINSEMAASVFLFAAQHFESVKSALEYILREVLLVTRRQLEEFLPDGRFGGELPAHTQQELRHCPLTNLIGENVFGEMDFEMSKKRNCSFHHLSSTQMMKYNKTPVWLDSKGAYQTSKLLSTARRRARQLRNRHRQQEQVVRLKIREKLLENEQKKRLKQAQAAQRQAALIRRVVAHGGPCQHTRDIGKLVARLRHRKKRNGQIKLSLQDEVRYQKVVLKRGKDLRIAGTVATLEKALRDHFSLNQPTPDNAQVANNDSCSEEDVAVPQTKRPRLESQTSGTDSETADEQDSGTAEDQHSEPITFSRQGEWVAVYYNDDFYIGQVVDVHSPTEATVKYLRKANGRADYFKWPLVEDVAKTNVFYVFRSNLEVVPVSSDFRVWKVDSIGDISAGYKRLKEQF